MKMVLRIALLAAMAAGLVWLWSVLFPSPEKAIRHRLDQIAKTASFGPDESPLMIAGKAQKLAGFVSTNVEVTLNGIAQAPQSLSGRDEVLQAAAGAHAAARSLTVQFIDVEVTVGSDKRSGTVNLTVRAQAGAERDFMVQPMRLTFEKIEGDWLIARVETVRTLN